MSAVSKMSLAPNGTPLRTPPLPARSLARAAASACSGSRWTQARTTGSRARIRSTQLAGLVGVGLAHEGAVLGMPERRGAGEMIDVGLDVDPDDGLAAAMGLRIPFRGELVRCHRRPVRRRGFVRRRRRRMRAGLGR